MAFDFTICIPTFNRGRRALENVNNILENLKKNWNVLVLDNSSTVDTNYYEEINSLSQKNKQLTYVKHETNVQFYGNFRACFEFAQSKYIMILSDEDFVNFESIESILNDLEKSEKIGACRTSIAPHKDLKNPGNSTTYPELYLEAGENALIDFSFTGNYVSGIIYNLENIKKTHLLSLLDKNIKSNKAYPHIYFDLLVSSLFDIIMTSKIAVLEGAPDKNYDDSGSDNLVATHIGLYGYGERINQFLAFRDAIDNAVNLIDFENPDKKLELFVNLYFRLVKKYFFLIFQANISNYINNNIEVDSLKESFFYITCAGILNHPNVLGHQEPILDHLIKIYQSFKN